MEDKPIVVGEGIIVGRYAELWTIDNGSCHVYIAPENMLGSNLVPGDAGILTYEYRGFSRVACFRGKH